ncbi:MAG: 50S ribosomal protein L4 [Thermoplasmata archaeon]|nr:50S ribosomal protein L4 [Thermoplasmata archaeon]
MQVSVRNMGGETVDEIELRADVFEIPVNVPVMHQAFVRQQANARLGTASTKTRGQVRGGGRKPWRQKGTGRARQGTIRAPQWRGGGTVFGPHPRSYTQAMPRKMRRLALRSALSAKAAEDRIIVLDSLELETSQTKRMIEVLGNLGVSSTALVLLPEKNENVERSINNLTGVKTLRANYLNIRDLLSFDYVVMPVGALEVIEGYLG